MDTFHEGGFRRSHAREIVALDFVLDYGFDALVDPALSGFGPPRFGQQGTCPRVILIGFEQPINPGPAQAQFDSSRIDERAANAALGGFRNNPYNPLSGLGYFP